MRERTFRGAAIKAVLTAISWLPLRAVHALGAALGWCAWVFRTRMYRITATNIARCMPALDPVARARLVRAALVENGKMAAELAPFWLWSAERVIALLDHDGAMDRIRTAHAQGDGVLVIAPHHGAWEIIGQLVSSKLPMTILYAPGQLGIDALVRLARERTGARLVPTDRHGVKALTRWLGEGGISGILPDQDPGDGAGVFVPFFDIPAKTTTLPSKLAWRTGARAFIVWAERLPDAQGYRMHCDPMPDAFYREPLEDSVAAMNAAIEASIRTRPEQYLWSYKRFRTRPEGEPGFYTR